MSEIVAAAWRRYLQQLQAHPLRTKAITSGVLAGCSDAIAQKISGAKRLQLRRMLLLMLYGFCYSGPFGHFLHKLMEKIFKGKKGKETVAKKVLLEQLTASPWNNFLFMTYYGLVLEGRSFSLVKRKLRNDYPSIQLTSWKFWPIVGWINYQYMPLQLRVLFHSFVASCWKDAANPKQGFTQFPSQLVLLPALSTQYKHVRDCAVAATQRCSRKCLRRNPSSHSLSRLSSSPPSSLCRRCLQRGSRARRCRVAPTRSASSTAKAGASAKPDRRRISTVVA